MVRRRELDQRIFYRDQERCNRQILNNDSTVKDLNNEILIAYEGETKENGD